MNTPRSKLVDYTLAGNGKSFSNRILGHDGSSRNVLAAPVWENSHRSSPDDSRRTASYTSKTVTSISSQADYLAKREELSKTKDDGERIHFKLKIPSNKERSKRRLSSKNTGDIRDLLGDIDTNGRRRSFIRSASQRSLHRKFSPTPIIDSVMRDESSRMKDDSSSGYSTRGSCMSKGRRQQRGSSVREPTIGS